MVTAINRVICFFQQKKKHIQTHILMGTMIAAMALAAAMQTQSPYIQMADSVDMYLQHEKWQDAERCILGALRAEPGNPANPMLVTNLGIVRNRMERYDEALESFDLALSRMPRSTVALTGRAEALVALQRNKEALEALDTATAIDSTLTLPLSMKAYLILKDNRPEEALESFRRMTGYDDVRALGYGGIGDCEAALGRDKEAIEAYKQALAIEERSEWRLRAGLLLLSAKDLEGAAEQANLGLKSAPRDGNMFILMSLIHRARFETTEAETAKKLAIDHGADPDLIHLYLE